MKNLELSEEEEAKQRGKDNWVIQFYISDRWKICNMQSTNT
jgi:hypothetical protein